MGASSRVRGQEEEETQLQNLTILEVERCLFPVVKQNILTLFHISYIGLLEPCGNISALKNKTILQCPLFTHLDLVGNYELFRGALRNIRSCKMLKYLDVSDCRELGVEAMKFVAEGCPELQNLDGSNIPMSDGVFRQIMRCRNLKNLLMKNCDLRYIDLNPISTNIRFIVYTRPGFQLREVKPTMPQLVIKQASYFSDGSEYFRITTDFISEYF
jgi:hypothetical protein